MAVSISNNLANKEYSSAGLRDGSSQSVSSSVQASSRSVNISKLNPGSTFSGEVISKDGNQITLKLANNETISAKLDGNANIDIGQKLTFEVAKSSGNQTTLRPLFSNLSSNSAVSSALEQANLPRTESNIAFTAQMMKEGMAVNRNALWSMSKTVSSFPNADPTTIVQMTKIGMEVNEANISQFDNYKNFQHQIINDAKSIASGLNDMLKESLLNDFSSSDVNITNDILSLVDTSKINSYFDSANTLNSDNFNQGILNSELVNNENVTLETANPESANSVSVNLAALNTEGALSATSLHEGINPEMLKGDVNSFFVDTLTSDKGIQFISQAEPQNFVLNKQLSLDENEQQQLLNNINDIIKMSGQGNVLSSPINTEDLFNTVKSLVQEYISGNQSIVDPQSPVNSEGLVDKESVVNSDLSVISEELTVTSSGEALSNNQSNADKLSNDSSNINNVINQNNTDSTIGKVQNTFDFVKTLGQKLFGIQNEAKEEIVINKTIEEQIKDKITDFIKSDSFGKVFQDSIKAQFTMNPSDINKEGKIEEFYKNIQHLSDKIINLMESSGKADSTVANAANNINDNVNFMNEINQYLNYVQLPLKMAGEDAHGELFVYGKRKNLNDNDGNFTALLHLDMDHLGPMDIYVTMREYTNVNTHFYLQTEELLDFIGLHIDELTQRLNDKGYNASVNMTQKNPGEKISPITEEFVKDENGTTRGMVSKFCFDVRA